MEIKQFVNSVFNSNTFVIHDDRHAVIVDMGDFLPVKEYLEKNNLAPSALLVTHVHYDHIYGIPSFMNEFPDTPIFTSSEGKESFKNPKWNFSRYHDDPISIDSPQIHTTELPFPEIAFQLDIPTLSGFSINLPDFKEPVIPIPTPGHDHSCVSFIIGDNLFSGDSFIPGVKVVDTFPKSDKSIAKNWYDKLESLSSSYHIYPGHGEILLRNP